MTRFGRKRNRMPQDTGTAKTFVEATGGGWGMSPMSSRPMEARRKTSYARRLRARIATQSRTISPWGKGSSTPFRIFRKELPVRTKSCSVS